MLNRRQEDKQNYYYFLTTCGLIGFIVFFVGAFLSFIVAAELDEYAEYTLPFGFAMLGVTLIFFVCVIHQSNNVHFIETEEEIPLPLPPQSEPELPRQLQMEEELLHRPQPEQEMPPQHQLEPELPLQPQQEFPLQPQPEQDLPNQPQQEPNMPLQLQSEPDLPSRPQLSSKPKKEPHWYDYTRLDFAYIREILGISPRNSNETTSSENDSDPDMQELKKMAKSGLPAGREEPIAGTSKESQDNGAISCEGAADDQLHSKQAESSKVAGKNSEAIESRSDSPLKGMSTLSLSDPSKCTTGSEEKQAEVSEALSLLSLDSPEKQVAEMAAQNESSTDPEGPPQAETSKKAIDGNSSELEEKK